MQTEPDKQFTIYDTLGSVRETPGTTPYNHILYERNCKLLTLNCWWCIYWCVYRLQILWCL